MLLLTDKPPLLVPDELFQHRQDLPVDFSRLRILSMMASAWPKVNATRYDHVMERKPRWRGIKDTEVQAAICDLSSLGWMQSHQGTGLLDDDSIF